MTRRLLGSYLSITALVLLIIEVPLGVVFARAEYDRLVAAVERDATVLATVVEDALEAGGTGGLDPVAAGYQDRTGGRVVVVDRAGVTVADSDPPAPGRRDLSTRPEIAAALRGQHTAGSRSSSTLGSSLSVRGPPVNQGSGRWKWDPCPRCWPWVTGRGRGQGGAPAATRGRTTLTPARGVAGSWSEAAACVTP
jgi:hypothetical protein